MRGRRKLEAGADGKADVMVLHDPIPRHLSIVSWGANDRPAESWKSLNDPGTKRTLLRSAPDSTAIDLASLTLDGIASFVGETLDAWVDTCSAVLAEQITSAERGARIRALTSQAGARVAALVHAIPQDRLMGASRSYKAAGLQLPTVPASSTLQGELDRRQFVAGLQQAAAALADRSTVAMKDPVATGYRSTTEAVLSYFGEVADIFAGWAASMPDGVVGIVPAETMNAGRRHAKVDEDRLKQAAKLILESLGELAEPATVSPPLSVTEKSMITLADFQKLVETNPRGFLELIDSAVQKSGLTPKEARKFAWGESGVEPYDAALIMKALAGSTDGSQLGSLIAQAIARVDVNRAASGDSPQVAATMQSAFAKFVANEITGNPTGELAVAVKGLVAPSVANAISQAIKSAIPGSDPALALDFDGSGGFAANEDPLTYLRPAAFPSRGARS